MKIKTFGSPSAEKEKDGFLVDSFVRTTEYDDVLNGDKHVLVGNRGVGKSAIFKKIVHSQKKDGLVIEMSHSDYAYDIFKTQNEGRKSWLKISAFTASWKFLIYNLIMNKLANKGGLKLGKSSKIYNYVRANHVDFDGNVIANLINYVNRIKNIEAGEFKLNLEASNLTKLYELQEIAHLIPIIYELCNKRKAFVLIDELDFGWDSSDDAKCYVASLFNAANQINFHPSNKEKSVKVIISLRKEIMDTIPEIMDERQKNSDIFSEIKWTKEELKTLMAKRIRALVPELKSSSDTDCWNNIFAEQLSYRKTKSDKYIVDRTLSRPREIIEFGNKCLANANKRGLEIIDYNVISEIIVDYSKARRSDIVSEYKYQYPNLDKIFEYFRKKKYTQKKDDLELLCYEIMEKEKIPWLDGQDEQFLIEVLWTIGFLRAYVVGGEKGGKGGSGYYGSHEQEFINLETISKFHVHPMFRDGLKMVE